MPPWVQESDGSEVNHRVHGQFRLAKHRNGDEDYYHDRHGWLSEFKPKVFEQLCRKPTEREEGGEDGGVGSSTGAAPVTKKERDRAAHHHRWSGEWKWMPGPKGSEDEKGDWFNEGHKMRLKHLIQIDEQHRTGQEAPMPPHSKYHTPPSGSRKQEDLQYMNEEDLMGDLNLGSDDHDDKRHRPEHPPRFRDLEDGEPLDDLITATISHISWRKGRQLDKDPVRCIEKSISEHGRKGELPLSTIRSRVREAGLEMDRPMVRALDDYDEAYRQKKNQKVGIDFDR